jgi:microcystin-dependent protein
MDLPTKASWARATAAGLGSLNPGAVGNAGGSQGHENRQPFLTLNFCIALQGIFPSQN